MNVRWDEVKGGWRRAVRRWVSAGSSVECGLALVDIDEAEVLVGSKSLSAGSRGVNCRTG